MSNDLKEQVVLVIGSCGLDRLLTVPAYPQADAKTRTTAYHENGGGNAANTATVIALLAGAAFLIESKKQVRVKLLTKVGGDLIGNQLVEELKDAGVDLSSPLFQVGKEESTTALTSIIVSEQEHTRTCFHTPGTCGELTPDDVSTVDMDVIFENVVHVHSDARHTDAALLVAKEARRRGIPVSVDVEKDRQSPALDSLLEIATHVYTNSDQIEAYLSRLNRVNEGRYGRQHLKDPIVVAKQSIILEKDTDLLTYALRPSTFLTRWFRQRGKQVIITKGELGAISVLCGSISSREGDDSTADHHQVELSIDDENELIRAHQTFVDRSTKAGDAATQVSADYRIRRAGVLSELRIVDTTGAGDAFIGGCVLIQLCCDLFKDPIQASLEFGCWVGGLKLAGPGARTALPTAVDVDTRLGRAAQEIEIALGEMLTPFGRPSSGLASLGGSWESFTETEEPGNSLKRRSCSD